ncbi:MAG: MogA/MoaB family molybdenum cofactor biosynthesis protein [Peptostreptococcales bacterium]|jgi:molybdopterin adenylyltransferase
MYKVGIITASDKGSIGEREDLSGKIISDILKNNGYIIEKYIILPDDEEKLLHEMIAMADDLKVDLILTTGGTGFGQRDRTPEATLRAIDRLTPGISEAIRAYSLQITPRAMLSRATSGIRNQTLIINLPGSPKAVQESLEYILATLPHGLEVLKGQAHECSR